MTDAEYEALATAARRYRDAVVAVFLKWDADANGRFDGKKTINCFCMEDLECDCCPVHRELRAAEHALSTALEQK